MKTLIVITGPTGVGKTDIAINIAKRLSAEIISADSRQLYREIPIGTAAPTVEEQAKVCHHFVGTLNLDQYYSAAQFETDVLKLLPSLFEKSDYAILCGGSMLYIDAICRGIDEIPTISDEIRNSVIEKYKNEGIESICAELQRLDPDYYAIVDHSNHKRIIHAIEICQQAGVPYTTLRTGKHKQRPFRIIKLGINLPRPQLFERINNRVEKMLENGMIEEAKQVYHLRHLNALNTVGYKELFAYFDGTMDYTTAKERIKKNTRVYAKKQLTWYAKDNEIAWLTPQEASAWTPL
ncbi:MAG: tRNA (adenosine(37)-N6)-dimethylallyltransferase MiaA [Muribaculaceae bacterium]